MREQDGVPVLKPDFIGHVLFERGSNHDLDAYRLPVTRAEVEASRAAHEAEEEAGEGTSDARDSNPTSDAHGGGGGGGGGGGDTNEVSSRGLRRSTRKRTSSESSTRGSKRTRVR